MKKTLWILVVAVILLLGVGMAVMGSASIPAAQAKKIPDDFFYMRRQAVWLTAAVFVGFLTSLFNYHNWQKLKIDFPKWQEKLKIKFPEWLKKLLGDFPLLTLCFYLVVVGLLVLTLCPGFAKETKGSFRWLSLGPLSIQPGEFAKLAIVIATAFWMDYIKRPAELAIVVAPVKSPFKRWAAEFSREIVVPGILLGVFAVLLFLEKDLGTTVVIGILALSLMCVAGMRKIYLFSFGGMGAGLVALWIATDAHRSARFMGWLGSFINPSAASDVSYHVSQSRVAFILGGLWGVGYNESTQKQHYLPEAYTDFVAAIGGEELGLFFSIGILVLYATLLFCGTKICLRAPDRFGRLLAFGMVMLLVFQAAFNIGVVTGDFPTKGLALPFISYGGSNLITALVAVGTLFNIGRKIDEHEARTYTPMARNARNTV